MISFLLPDYQHMKKKSKKKKQDIAKVYPELQGVDIRINPFGEMSILHLPIFS